MNSSERHISLVDKVIINTKTNVFKRAIALGDADNDPNKVNSCTIHLIFLYIVFICVCLGGEKKIGQRTCYWDVGRVPQGV